MADVTQKDLDDTAKALGLKPRRAAPASAPVVAAPEPAADYVPTDDELEQTARAMGIKRERVSDPAKEEATPPASSAPLKITVTRPVQRSGSMTQQLEEGMPIIGPLAQKATAAMTATVDPLAKLITPNNPNLADMPDTWGGRYDRNLTDMREASNAYREANPGKSILANLTGGAMAMGPVASSRAGSTILGMTGPAIGTRMVTGAAGGAGIGAADAALRGESATTGAEIGGLLGLVGPAIGHAVRGVTNAAMNLLPRSGILRGVPAPAVNQMVGAMEGETPRSISAARDRMGPAGMVSDINPAFTDLAGGVAAIPGPGKAAVRGAYKTQGDEQAARIKTALDTHIAPHTNIEDLKNSIAAERKALSDPLYKQWETMQVHPTDELKALIPRLEKSGAFDLAEETAGVTGKPMTKAFFTSGDNKRFPTTESWNLVKRGLDRRIDQAYAAGDKSHARDLIGLKNELLGEIEKTDAGKVWKQARAAFAEKSSLMDQIEAGRDTFLGGRAGLTADELREELKGLSQPELQARIIGMRSAAKETMGATARGDTTLRNKILADNNIEKMELLIGKDKAKKLVQTMEQEEYLGNQRQNVSGGSQTTPNTQRVNKLLPPPHVTEGWDVTKPGTWIPAAWRENANPFNFFPGVGRFAQAERYAKATHSLAPLLTLPSSHPDFNALMRALRRESTRRSVVDANATRAGSALSGLVSVPATTTARRQYFPAN